MTVANHLANVYRLKLSVGPRYPVALQPNHFLVDSEPSISMGESLALIIFMYVLKLNVSIFKRITLR